VGLVGRQKRLEPTPGAVAIATFRRQCFRMLVFIDESGDPGFKLSKGSSDVFVAAMVAFRSQEVASETQATIEALARRLGLKSEFKFHKSRPPVRDAFFGAVHPHDFLVRAIVVEKERIYSQRLRTNKESFYKFFVKSMLKFDNGLLEGAKVVIDGNGDREFRQELAAYLRRGCGRGAIKDVRFKESERDRLVQLADMCAGAIARSFKPDRDDKDRWRKMLGRKIHDVWRFG
jgi:hypothetical protein